MTFQTGRAIRQCRRFSRLLVDYIAIFSTDHARASSGVKNGSKSTFEIPPKAWQQSGAQCGAT
jgi:hypothetical protein